MYELSYEDIVDESPLTINVETNAAHYSNFDPKEESPKQDQTDDWFVKAFILLNTLSVYFCCQMMKYLPWIHRHEQVTSVALFYNALHSVLVVLGIYFINPVHVFPQSSKTVYSIVSHISAFSFASMGSISWLSDFTLTPGFWSRLPVNGKICIVAGFIIITAVVVFQGYRAYTQKTFYQQFAPLSLIILLWFSLWVLLEENQIKHSLHLHHALFGGIFSCWFTDFLDMWEVTLNSVFIGICIEGINFYAIEDFNLFVVSNDPVHWSGVVITWAVLVVLLAFTVVGQSECLLAIKEKYLIFFKMSDK